MPSNRKDELRSPTVRCRISDPQLSRTSERFTPLDEIELDPRRKTTVCPEGCWTDVCFWHGIVKKSVPRAHEMVMVLRAKRLQGLPSDWCLSQGSQSAEGVSAPVRLMWLIEETVPTAWELLKSCVAASFEVKQWRFLFMDAVEDLKNHRKIMSELCASCFIISDTPLLKCEGCRTVHYCDRKCQKAHWKVHKPSCGALAQRRATSQVCQSKLDVPLTRKVAKDIMKQERVIQETKSLREAWSETCLH